VKRSVVSKILSAGKEKAQEIAVKLKGKVWDSLTPHEQKLFQMVAVAEHVLATVPKKVQELAARVCREQGLDEDTCSGVQTAAKIADMVAGWTVNIPFAHNLLHSVGVDHKIGEAATFLVAKVGYYLPIGSLCYLADQSLKATMRGDPLALIRAAKKMITESLTKQQKAFDTSSLVALAQLLARNKDPLFLALVSAAMDRTRDLTQAITTAQTIYQTRRK